MKNQKPNHHRSHSLKDLLDESFLTHFHETLFFDRCMSYFFEELSDEEVLEFEAALLDNAPALAEVKSLIDCLDGEDQFVARQKVAALDSRRLAILPSPEPKVNLQEQIIQGFKNVLMRIDWSLSARLIVNPRSSAPSQAIDTAIYKIEVAELVEFGWNPIVERQVEISSIDSTELVYRFSRLSKSATPIRFGLVLESGRVIPSSEVSNSELRFEVSADEITSPPGEILFMGTEAND